MTMTLYQRLTQTTSRLENGGLEALDSKELIDLLDELLEVVRAYHAVSNV